MLASSAAMFETIPPSLAMLVLGSVAPISIGTLFIAGLLPAAVIAALLMILNYVLSRNNGTASVPRATMPELLRASWRRDPALGDAGDHGDRHPPRHRHADGSLRCRRALWPGAGLRDLSRGGPEDALHDCGRLLSARRHGAVHHCRCVLVRLDANGGQPARQSGRDPAFARRQPHRVHSWLDRAADRGRLTARRLCPR